MIVDCTQCGNKMDVILFGEAIERMTGNACTGQ